MQQSAYPVGLTTAEATARQATEGLNELEVSQRRGFLRIAGEVASEPMFLLLLGAGSIYLLMGDLNEALMLLAFVCIINKFNTSSGNKHKPAAPETRTP